MHFSKPWLELPFWEKRLQNSGFEITHHTGTTILRDVSLKIAATTWHLETQRLQRSKASFSNEHSRSGRRSGHQSSRPASATDPKPRTEYPE